MIASFLGKMTSYFDDEPILSIQDDPDVPKRRPFIADKTQVTVINKKKAPLEATNFTVLLELTGNGSEDDKPGVDIVTVLDVSGSMKHDKKLEKLKTAMQFMIKKLSRDHRLSVVTFSKRSSRLCPLRQMTEKAQQEIEKLVNDLTPGGGTNIAEGLRLALKVLDERKISKGRVAAVMLMSDGDQGSMYEDARRVPVQGMPVFTFGFGRGNEYNPEVLNAVAKNSNGGTFSIADVENTESNNLNIAFAQCLAGLLTVVVQDLKLVVTKVKPEIVINNVSAGNYPKDGDATAKTISFGNLYNGEKRKVLVDLALPVVTTETGYKALDITYSYTYDGEPFDAPPISVSVVRTGGEVDEEVDEVINEQKREEVVGSMERATCLADNNKFDAAQNELKQAQDSLDAVKLNNFIEMLKSELHTLLGLMQTPEIYKSKGKHYALATLTSHARQRMAARGDDPAKATFFATPAMKAIVNQAIDFVKNPEKPVPVDIPIDEPTMPAQPTIVTTPLGPIIGPVSQHLGIAIRSLKDLHDSLQAIQDLLLKASQ